MRRVLRALTFWGGLVLLPAPPLFAYQAGALRNHSHSTAAGQGGATINPSSVNASTITASSGTFTNATITNLTLTNLNASGITVLAGSSITVPTLGASVNLETLAGSTLTVSGNCVNMECLFLSSRPLTGTSTGYTGAIYSSETYRYRLTVLHTGSDADYYIRFGTTTTAGYLGDPTPGRHFWATTYGRTGQTPATNGNRTTGAECRLNVGDATTAQIGAGDTPQWHGTITTYHGRAILTGTGSNDSTPGTNMDNFTNGCEYRGPSGPASITVIPSVGTWNGEFVLFREGK